MKAQQSRNGIKSILFTLIIGIFGLISSTSLMSQEYIISDSYGIGFAVASDFNVYQNDYDLLNAVSSDGLLSISVEPWLDNSVTLDNVYDAVVYLARGANYLNQGAVAGDYIQIDYFNGYFLVCAPNIQGSYDYIIIAILLDIYSNTNLAVTIGYQEGHFEEARDMLLSFYAYD